ncbi:MAG: 30S ribosomal protein S5 [Candidatus Pacearchaeota archaeon]|nr:30S ribosomal protein S5 [Candidatus Nealsonbacteria bacterium]MDZ4226683.1 30S ribosomal protein S5 [Candidatus Pacearchaeota archaeon]
MEKSFSKFRRRGPERPKDDFESKLLDLARISHTRAGGRKMRFRSVVVIGDKKGKVGLGIAKGQDVAASVEKATRLARKHLIQVPMSGETIPHEVISKVGASRILLRPQRRGRGLVAGGTVRVVCSLAGIKDISSKVLSRTGNKINNARATIEALKKLKERK